MRDCDLTLVVSSSERELLAVDAPGVKVDVLALVHEVNSSKTPFADRKDLLFVGGFQHPPNIDAVVWFAESVLPRVRQRLPEVCLHVIGSKVTPAIQQLASDAIRVHGFIEDISPWLDGCRVSIAPIRYGAGVKGKVTMAMSCGLPVVATSIAVEGIHARDNTCSDLPWHYSSCHSPWMARQRQATSSLFEAAAEKLRSRNSTLPSSWCITSVLARVP